MRGTLPHQLHSLLQQPKRHPKSRNRLPEGPKRPTPKNPPRPLFIHHRRTLSRIRPRLSRQPCSIRFNTPRVVHYRPLKKRRGTEAAITAPTRNRMGGESPHVGSNPTLSANCCSDAFLFQTQMLM